MSDWQPIDTAPKDAAILLYGENRKHGTRFIDIGLSTDERHWDGRALWAFGISSHPATHWMPLPEPPKP